MPAQTIIDSFLGIMFGMFIGAVVGGLLWPILPQRILRDSLLELIGGIKALLNGDSHAGKIRVRLESLPEEALWAIHQNRVASCSEEEKSKMRALISAPQMLVARIEQLVSRRDKLPEIATAVLGPQFERLEVEFDQVLSAALLFTSGKIRHLNSLPQGQPPVSSYH